MPLILPQLATDTLSFPPPSQALTEPDGLLAFGGDLSYPRMREAYRNGIFPWFSAQDPILWWSPDPRAVLYPEEFHLSRSMARFHRQSPYQVTIDQDFEGVIRGCAAERSEGTWITEEVINAWRVLAHKGDAHSVEVWQDGQLAGGLYGMAVGQLFCAESMFSTRPNASKTALMLFCRHFTAYGGKLIDCQILNPHTASLGVTEISREAYLQQVARLQRLPLTDGCWQTGIRG